MATRCAILTVLIFSISGCAGSRWARSDAEYELKYPEHSDKILQTVKQAVDARFIGGRSGAYGSFGGSSQPSTVTAEVGLIRVVKPWLETRAGVVGIAGSPNKSLYGGGTAGIRINSPSRLAPFVGVGAYAGIEPWELIEDRESDFPDTGDDDFEASDFIFAAAPEVGMHYWITPEYRLTTSASYYAGWSAEPWLYSVSLTFVRGEQKAEPTDWSNWSAENWTN